jgi:hypothetical protein
LISLCLSISCVSIFCFLSVFSQFSFFLPLSRAIPYKLDIRFSVYIRPVFINALSLRESSSRLGLHNNALGLRESLSRLGLHNNALGLRESSSRLGLHKCPFACVSFARPCSNMTARLYPLFLSSVWLPSSFLNPGLGRLPASSYK